MTGLYVVGNHTSFASLTRNRRARACQTSAGDAPAPGLAHPRAVGMDMVGPAVAALAGLVGPVLVVALLWIDYQDERDHRRRMTLGRRKQHR